MQKPLISIIIPTYNRAHLLPRAIKSVINQTYSNFELIIVNDGSTDNTPEVVKSFKDPRIIYLTYEKGPKGPNFARNTGLNVAKGELITFMCDDDELTSDALKSIADTFIRVKPLGAEILIFDELDVEKNRLSGSGLGRTERFVDYDEILCKVEGDFLCVYSRKTLKGFRFPDIIRFGFEEIACLQLFKKFLTYHVPQVIYKCYREHGLRLSQPPAEDRIKLLPTAIHMLNLFIEKYGKDLLHHCPTKYWNYIGKLGFYQFLNGKKIHGLKKIFASLPHGGVPKYKFLFTLLCLPIPSKGIIYLYRSSVNLYDKYKNLLSLRKVKI